MSNRDESDVVAAVRSQMLVWSGDKRADHFLDWVGDADFVLIGEATHGTHEFYAERAWLTRQLIERHGFNAIAIEGDWPHAQRVHQYVQGYRLEQTPNEALGGFARFPQWMWRNTVMEEFVDWLRRWNSRQMDAEQRVGFYGLDLYSLHESMRAVIDYLETAHPDLAKAARRSYSCFEDFGEDPESYAWAAGRLGEGSCEDAVVEQLLKLRQREYELLREGDADAKDDFFSAEQNARLAKNAERYYRTMVRGRIESWNLRDRHMAETLDEVARHLLQRSGRSKIVVWAHNSHLGDARATELGDAGELNLGQLVRENYGAQSRLLGLTTYAGSVTAAEDWGEPARKRRVRNGLSGSYEALLHDVNEPRFFLDLTSGSEAAKLLAERRIERAIGVIYRPETERYSHYFNASLSQQFDAVLHIDETSALQPLETSAEWQRGELPETYPTGV
jgi:erythromycin esterase-like protein